MCFMVRNESGQNKHCGMTWYQKLTCDQKSSVMEHF